MGEYAIRKSDRIEVKIGTCEEMYYLRYEDREKVMPVPNSVNPARDACALRFRLPFPDEDNVPIGQYEPYSRGLRLHRTVKDHMGREWAEDFKDESTVEDPGTLQLHHKDSGLLLNVPCYHGHKLPDFSAPVKAFWNGKGHSLELASVRPVESDGVLLVKPVVRCRHCGQAWRYEWADIWEYIPDPVMRVRFAPYKDACAEVTA